MNSMTIPRIDKCQTPTIFSFPCISLTILFFSITSVRLCRKCVSHYNHWNPQFIVIPLYVMVICHAFPGRLRRASFCYFYVINAVTCVPLHSPGLRLLIGPCLLPKIEVYLK